MLKTPSFDSSASHEEHADIAIIGAGFAGICMAIRLKLAGLEDFFIAEAAASLGGTWRDNDYPGCACDVQSPVYSFSFAPNPGWTRMFAPQREIRAYLESCAQRFGIVPHVRFNEALQRATFDEPTARWRLDFANGRRVSARVLVSGMGGLSRASTPALDGLDTFQGQCFHSQHWNHAYAFEGKRVAVIGTGASAIQFVPQIAPSVVHLALFQRSPPWIMPRPDRTIGPRARGLFGRHPFAQRIQRTMIFWMLETRAIGFVLHPPLMKIVQEIALRHLKKQVRDPALRRVLTPDYTLGCKRILLSNDYYPAVSRQNVEIVTAPIKRVESNAIVTADGARHAVDCIVFGTGFQTAEVFPRGLIFGRDGVDIADAWRDGAHAYLGTVTAGYPNFFMLYGPNTGLGHNSMVFMIEAQADYVLRALTHMRERGIGSIDVKPEVESRYDAAIQRKLAHTIWATGGCTSWYIDPRTGRNATLWPGFAWQFKRAAREFRESDYVTRLVAGTAWDSR